MRNKVDNKSTMEAIKLLNRTMKKVLPAIEQQLQQQQQQDKKKQPTRRESMAVPDLLPIKELEKLEMVPIKVRAVFMKLGEIDTVGEKFQADAFIQARWREPCLDGQAQNTEYELQHFDKYWNPQIYILNAIGEPVEKIWYMVVYNEQGRATVCERRRVKGVFFEQMELGQYPFDTQDITLTVATHRTDYELDMAADEVEISTVGVQSFVDEQEWFLHKHVNTWSRLDKDEFKDNKHPAVSISCTITRRSKFFLWNIIIVMIFISSLIFGTFTVNVNIPENRLQLSFLLLLSNITFKFTVNQALPKVSYLTYMDKYILLSMMILCLVCMWHGIVGALYHKYGPELATTADIGALVILGALYIFFNLFFFFWIRELTQKKQKEYAKKDLKQKEKQDQIESNNIPSIMVSM